MVPGPTETNTASTIVPKRSSSSSPGEPPIPFAVMLSWATGTYAEDYCSKLYENVDKHSKKLTLDLKAAEQKANLPDSLPAKVEANALRQEKPLEAMPFPLTISRLWQPISLMDASASLRSSFPAIVPTRAISALNTLHEPNESQQRIEVVPLTPEKLASQLEMAKENRTFPTLPPEMLTEALVLRAATLKTDETAHFWLVLHPQELGRIEVLLSLDKADQLTVYLIAQPENQALLEKEQTHLMNQLKKQKLAVEKIVVCSEEAWNGEKLKLATDLVKIARSL